jgi:FixJ family two-component response regulator
MDTPFERACVAILDDEVSVRISLRRLCSALGLRPTTFASGPELLDALERGEVDPDCLLLDARMPTMTGLEVHRLLLSRNVRLPTVVYTADDAPEAKARYLAAGISEYLHKPIGGEELVAAIERAIAERDAPRPWHPLGAYHMDGT